MARKKTKVVDNWEDLTKWIGTLNPYKNTVVLSGWVNKLNESTGKVNIEVLVFNIAPVDILKEHDKNDIKSTSRIRKKD